MSSDYNTIRIDGLKLPQMRICEELVYYDRPLCYLLGNEVGQYYLSHYLRTVDKEEQWYLSPLAESSILSLLSGKIALLSALSLSPVESRFIIAVRERDHEHISIGNVYNCPELQSLAHYLPNEKMVFLPDEFTGSIIRQFEPIVQYANSTLAEVIYISLKGAMASNPAIFPISKLASLGKAIQRLITNIVSASENPTALKSRGAGQHSIEVGSQFALTGLCPGSVRLRLESVQADTPNMFPELDYAHKGASELLDLMGKQEGESICDTLKVYPPRLTSSFRNYVSQLDKMGIGVDVEWASKRNQGHKSVSWSRDEVAQIAKIISAYDKTDERTITAKGHFVEGSMETKKFKFIDIETDESYEGKFADSIDDDVVKLCSSDKHTALYNVTVYEKSSVTKMNTTLYEYLFVDVDPEEE